MPPNFSICGTYIRSTLFLSFPDRQQGERLPLLASIMAEEEEFTGQSEAADAKELGSVLWTPTSRGALGCSPGSACCGCGAPGALLEHCAPFSFIPRDSISGAPRS